MLDRNLAYQMSIGKALRCGLISFDSTMHSNLSVGMSLDLLVYRKDSFVDAKSYRITYTTPLTLYACARCGLPGSARCSLSFLKRRRLI